MIKNEKNLFETPEIEIISFDCCDVSTASTTANDFDATGIDRIWNIGV